MRPEERIRFWTFWALDRVRGGRVRAHVRELALLNDDPALAEKRRAERLQDLLDHACRTTPYYRQFSGAATLGDFPVLQKRTIRERHADFLSSAYQPPSLVMKHTSGSYGTPLAFYFSPEKAARHRAEVIYHTRWAGYEIGMKHAQTRTRSVKSPFCLWMQNQTIVNPTHMTQEWLAEQRQRLRTEKIRLLIGFPSAFRAIAVSCKAAGDTSKDYALKAVIGIAEPLREEARREIETAFGCPAYSRYTTEEFGVLGQECPAAKQHHLNRASYVFELLHLDRDEPVAPGELGRVVVTDLWSHAMPLIRYDLGDLAVMAEPCACGWNGPVRTRIEGRAVDVVYDAVGERISPFAVNSAMQDLDNVVQYQFVQHSPGGYTVRLVALPAFGGEEMLRNRLLPLLGGEAARLSFEYVTEIAPLPSGKRPVVVNEMPPTEQSAADPRSV